MSLRLAVHALLQHRARLETQHAAPADGNRLPGLRVASSARLLFVDDEIAEARNLDLLAALEVLLDDLEDRVNDFAGLFLREADLLVNAPGNIGLRRRHGGAPLSAAYSIGFSATSYCRGSILRAAHSAVVSSPCQAFPSS